LGRLLPHFERGQTADAKRPDVIKIDQTHGETTDLAILSKADIVSKVRVFLPPMIQAVALLGSADLTAVSKKLAAQWLGYSRR
jgi:hypothetical protein